MRLKPIARGAPVNQHDDYREHAAGNYIPSLTDAQPTEASQSDAYDLLEPPWWHAKAACKGSGVDMQPETPSGIQEALAVCGGCRVVAECAADAAAHNAYGVWGGVHHDPSPYRDTQQRGMALLGQGLTVVETQERLAVEGCDPVSVRNLQRWSHAVRYGTEPPVMRRKMSPLARQRIVELAAEGYGGTAVVRELAAEGHIVSAKTVRSVVSRLRTADRLSRLDVSSDGEA